MGFMRKFLFKSFVLLSLIFCFAGCDLLDQLENSSVTVKVDEVNIEDLVEGQYYCEITVEGDGFNATKRILIESEDQFYEIRSGNFAVDFEIPVGTKVSATAVIYKIEVIDRERVSTPLVEGKTGEISVAPGDNAIEVICRDKEPVKIYVEYNDDTKTMSSETYETISYKTYEENAGHNGKTQETAFNYIQAAIDWIAENGNSDEDYEIILSGYDSKKPFKQRLDFKNTLDGKAKSIILTSTNPTVPALKVDSSYDYYLYNTNWLSCICVDTKTPLVLKNIKISASLNTTHVDSFILSTAPDNSSCDVTLGEGTAFIGEEGNITGSGAAVTLNGGKLKMKDDASISGFNVSNNGGAVYVNYGTFTMSGNSVIENCNSETYGGAVYVGQAGSFIMGENSVIKSCSSKLYGGAVYIGQKHGNAGLNDNATITECSSDQNGGGVYVAYGSLSMDGGFIKDCSATYYGGGVYLSAEYEETNFYFRGGEISNNTAGYKGSGIYIDQDVSVSPPKYPSVIMAKDACVDTSNDIFTKGPSVQLANSLTTKNKTAALITYSYSSSLSGLTVLKKYGTDAAVIANSYSKFWVRNEASSGYSYDWYIDSEGIARDVDFVFETGDTENEVLPGDIVFSDNRRIRGENFEKITYDLYNSIAGVVFYAGTDEDLLGKVNLIAGTETYEDYFENRYYDSNCNYNIFDETDITSFPDYLSNYAEDGTITLAELQNSDFSFISNKNKKETGNYGISNFISIPNDKTNLDSYTGINRITESGAVPLYKKIIEYGNTFPETSPYYLDNQTYENNWYIPNIAEYKVFAEALKNETFVNTYKAVTGSDLSGEYMSETILHKNSYSYPQTYRPGYESKYYPLNFTINFKTGIIATGKTPPFNYTKYKAFPVHIYSVE